MLLKSIILLQNAQTTQSNPLVSLLPIIVMFVALYLLFILPQQRASKKHKQMIAELKKGDKIITQSGIIGTITLIKDDVVHLEIAPKIEIRIIKSSITRTFTNNNELKINE